jgi:hypothetical protein
MFSLKNNCHILVIFYHQKEEEDWLNTHLVRGPHSPQDIPPPSQSLVLYPTHIAIDKRVD